MQYRYGKVYEFENGEGIIVTDDKNYIFLDTDIKGDQAIQKNDFVNFYDEDNKYNRARFVKKIEKKNINCTTNDLKTL